MPLRPPLSGAGGVVSNPLGWRGRSRVPLTGGCPCPPSLEDGHSVEVEIKLPKQPGVGRHLLSLLDHRALRRNGSAWGTLELQPRPIADERVLSKRIPLALQHLLPPLAHELHDRV